MGEGVGVIRDAGRVVEREPLHRSEHRSFGMRQWCRVLMAGGTNIPPAGDTSPVFES